MYTHTLKYTHIYINEIAKLGNGPYAPVFSFYFSGEAQRKELEDRARVKKCGWERDNVRQRMEFVG